MNIFYLRNHQHYIISFFVYNPTFFQNLVLKNQIIVLFFTYPLRYESEMDTQFLNIRNYEHESCIRQIQVLLL